MPRGLPLPHLCLAVFLVVWVALAVAPRSRETWLLENLLTLVAVPALVLSYRRFRFSDRAYVQGAIFLTLHTVGSHYTYSHVPLGDWIRDAVDLTRNHYDRGVHFAFGLLTFLPNGELFLPRDARLGRGRALFLTFALVAWWSVLYELIEWWTAVVVDPRAGTAFLGTQGDAWDAQKDMAAACAGALLAAAIEASRAVVRGVGTNPGAGRRPTEGPAIGLPPRDDNNPRGRDAVEPAPSRQLTVRSIP